uniref:Protein T05C12.11 n=1 Tax=Haemonchus contortus TaxID=6289 RepID=W6NTX4_HAECO
MLPDLVKLLIFTLIQAAELALLRINRWYELPMVAGQRAVLDFNLYLTCERFSLIFASDIDDLNRLTFLFDGEDLRKVDVDSPDYVTVPSPPPVIGGCRETDFKALQVNVSFREHTFEVQIGRQIAIRPKSNTSETMRLLLPQKGACCLVSGVLMLGNESLTESILSNSEDIREANFSKQSFIPTTSTPSYNTKHRALLVDMRIPPSTKPTRAPDVRQVSWTEMVNREWSVSFLVCSISVSVVMIVMVTLGIVIFLYVQIKPPTSKRCHLIEEY